MPLSVLAPGRMERTDDEEGGWVATSKGPSHLSCIEHLYHHHLSHPWTTTAPACRTLSWPTLLGAQRSLLPCDWSALSQTGSGPTSVSFCLYLWAILGRLAVASPTKLVSLSHVPMLPRHRKLAGLPAWDALGLVFPSSSLLTGCDSIVTTPRFPYLCPLQRGRGPGSR